MNFIIKYRYPLIGTALLHVLFFIYAINTKITEFKFPKEEFEMVAELDFTEMQQQEQQQNQQELSQQELLNATVNVSQKQSTYTNAINTSKLDKQVEEDMKNLESKFFEELQKDKPKDEKQTQTKNQNTTVVKKDAEKNDEAALGADVYATASYELEGRYDLALPAPSYTCRSEGRVVLDVKVNQEGQVKSATVNSYRTNTKNECLINAAIDYAKRARFNQNFKATSMQSGTITFVYARQ
ncbi:MAG: energy transducer TonB [Bacteroidia bacterium]